MPGLDWKWIGLQVGLPLFGPILLSFLLSWLWLSLKADFVLDVAVIVDMTPWALAVYSLTLIGSTFQTFAARFGANPWLGGGLVMLAAIEAVYYAFMVVLRHDPHFVVRAESYYVMGVMVCASIVLCYRAR